MKRELGRIIAAGIIIFMVACKSNENNQDSSISVQTIGAAVNATLSAMPSQTQSVPPSATSERLNETKTESTKTNTQFAYTAPLYYELDWDILGSNDQEIVVDGSTNKKIVLSGTAYQAQMPPGKNDFVNRIRNYYSQNNLSTMGWIMVNGWGGVDGILTEYFNYSGYFLTVRFNNKQPSIIVWISEYTTVIPTIP